MNTRMRNATMHAGRAIVGIFCLSLFFVFIAAGPADARQGAKSGSKANTGAATEWKGSESDLAAHFISVVSDEKTWKELWKNAFRKNAPRVNFRKHAVACVFLGHYPGWWYVIDMLEPYATDTTIIIPYQLVSLIVDLKSNGQKNVERRYGSRGQYLMKVVEKKAGYQMKMQMVGNPEIPPHFRP
ncbi:MAG: hypothetical protein WAW37_06610 [Syntrophobacteraceae bacterium]